MKRAPDIQTLRKLPTAVTAPPVRPRDMPVQDIAIWTPKRAAEAIALGLAQAFGTAARADTAAIPAETQMAMSLRIRDQN